MSGKLSDIFFVLPGFAEKMRGIFFAIDISI